LDLDNILYGDADIKVDLNSTLLNPVASTVPKWQTFELLRFVLLLNHLVDLDEILYGGYDIEEDVDSILFNPVASTISKWWTFKHLWWVHLFN
jgi:hypothetical protein